MSEQQMPMWWVHGVIVALNTAIAIANWKIWGSILKHHDQWQRMKVWLIRLDKEYCERHGIPFIPLENGDSE